VQPDDQLHVLGHRADPEAAGLQDRGPPEQPKGAGDDEQALEVAPAGPVGEEGAGVLQHLEALQPLPGDPGLGDAPVLDQGCVQGPDRPAHRDQGLVLDEQPAGPQDGLAVQQRVGVDGQPAGDGKHHGKKHHGQRHKQHKEHKQHRQDPCACIRLSWRF
jgi:hypothetical protein